MPLKGQKLAQTDLQAIESRAGLRIKVSAAEQRLTTDRPDSKLNQPVSGPTLALSASSTKRQGIHRVDSADNTCP
jgi:hypothetical protein